jgi:hypothetical protein
MLKKGAFQIYKTLYVFGSGESLSQRAFFAYSIDEKASLKILRVTHALLK